MVLKISTTKLQEHAENRKK